MQFLYERLKGRYLSAYLSMLGARPLFHLGTKPNCSFLLAGLDAENTNSRSVNSTALPVAINDRNVGRKEEVIMSNFKLSYTWGGYFILLLNIVLSTLLFMVGPVHAATNCNISTPSSYVTTLPGSTINAGEDLPLGSVIYNFTTTLAVHSGVTCSTDSPPQTFSVPVNLDYLLNPLPLSGYSGGGLAGKVYETGLPGVGVVITGICRPVNKCLMPRADNTFNFSLTNTGPFTITIGRGWIVWFIKTGPISPGAINGSLLPTIKTFIGQSPSYIAEAGNINTVSFNGSLNVVSATCTTPDVNVPLGSHDIGTFGTVGATTPWVDASIQLTNCSPAFSGYYDLNNSSVSIIGAGSLPAGTRTNNLLNVVLTPQNSIIDATNGIMSVSSNTAAPAAEGIGIQLAWGSASSSPTPFSFNGSQNFTPASDGRQSITIPLAARYIRTGSELKPGRADGKVTFTINYY